MAKDPEDRRRVEAQNSKMDTFAGAEGEKIMREGEEAESRQQGEAIGEASGVLHSSPGSSTDVRIEPIPATPQEADLDARPVV